MTFGKKVKFGNHSVVAVIRVIVTGEKNSHRLSNAIKGVAYKLTKSR